MIRTPVTLSKKPPTVPSLVDLMQATGLDGESWAAWRTVARCLDGEALTSIERELYEQCTQRTRPLTERPSEVFIIVGRRGGKSLFTSRVAARASGFSTYPSLAPGETAVVAVAAADRAQARVLYNYAASVFEDDDHKRRVRPRSPWTSLAELVTRRTRWEMDFRNDTQLAVATASFGRIRGRTFAAALCDEIAFWQDDTGANPAAEVLRAVRPALATLRGQLICISSPFAKSGELWTNYTRYWGKDDPSVLIWKAPTRVMNPLIPERIVLDALERDPEAASAEWLSEFRDAEGALLAPEAIARVVVVGRGDLEPLADVDHLVFVDAASGSGADSMTLAVSHVEEEASGRLIVVVDALREVKPPFAPEDVVRDFVEVARRFGATRVYGDRFAMGWTDAAFRRESIEYVPSPLTRSDIYIAALSLINSRQIELPDHAKLIQQLSGLSRRAGSSGREIVDHGSGKHDDISNVVAGAASIVYRLAIDQPHTPAMVW